MKDPVEEQDDKNLDDEFKRIEEERKLREKQETKSFNEQALVLELVVVD